MNSLIARHSLGRSLLLGLASGAPYAGLVAMIESLGGGVFSEKQVFGEFYRPILVRTFDLEGDADLDVLFRGRRGGEGSPNEGRSRTTRSSSGPTRACR